MSNSGKHTQKKYNPEMLVFVDETGWIGMLHALRPYMVTHYKGKENVIGAMCARLIQLGGHRRLLH